MATRIPCQSPLLPCLYPGCKRWFKNQTGLKCHARTHPLDNGSLLVDDDTMEIIDDLNSTASDDSSNGEYMYEHI